MLDAPAITAAIAKGDRAAVATLYEAKFGLVFAAARRAIGRDEQTCLDVAQETFMKALRKIPILDSEQALDAWLTRTAKRAAYDTLRATRRRERRHERAGEATSRVPAGSHASAGAMGDEPSSAAAADRAERLAWLRRELGLLDRSAADALDLRLRAGLTLANAGRLLGLTPGAVDGRVSRAVETLRVKAREDFDA